MLQAEHGCKNQNLYDLGDTPQMKLNFRPYIRRYTLPNENFEYGYPHSNARLQWSAASPIKPHVIQRNVTHDTPNKRFLSAFWKQTSCFDIFVELARTETVIVV